MLYCCAGGGGEFLQLRRQSAAVRLGLDLPDYIPLPSTDVRAPSCCDVLSTTSGQNVDEPPDTASPDDGGRAALTGEILRQLRVIVARLRVIVVS